MIQKVLGLMSLKINRLYPKTASATSNILEKKMTFSCDVNRSSQNAEKCHKPSRKHIENNGNKPMSPSLYSCVYPNVIKTR